MEKMIIIVVCLCVMIKYNQSQQPTTLFHCTFDDGTVGDCIFNAITPMTGGLQIDAGQELSTSASSPPARPLSDVTSVFSPTKNDDICQFPYNINGWEMYFCQKKERTSQYTCPTSTNGNQECADGTYAYLSSNSGAVSKYYESREIIHLGTTESQCLTFYYYFTKNNSNAFIDITWRTSSSPSYESSIVKVHPQRENKWHKNQVSFNVPYSSYILRFEFSRDPHVSNTDPFFFAIDDISVTTGSCAKKKTFISAIMSNNVQFLQDDSIYTTETSVTTTLPTGPISFATGDPQSNTDGETTTTTISSTTSKSTSSSSTRSTLSPEEATSDDSTYESFSNTTFDTIILTSSTTSTTTSTIGSNTSTSTIGSSTPKPGNFGVNHGLSFGIGILTVLMYFTIII